jgi:hypothetical protein
MSRDDAALVKPWPRVVHQFGNPKPVADTDPGPSCGIGDRKIPAKKLSICKSIIENLIEVRLVQKAGDDGRNSFWKVMHEGVRLTLIWPHTRHLKHKPLHYV